MYLQTLGATALHPESASDSSSEPLLRGSKTLVLVAYLADRPARSASRAHLAELFWPGVPSTRARRSLRQALYFLSHSGGEGVLDTTEDIVRLSPDCCELDFRRFEQALAEQRFEDAAELYTGLFLEGYDPGRSRELATWIESVRERLEVGYRQALRQSARASLARDEPEPAVEYARRACAAFPLDDPVHALLIEALTAAGRPGEAVREYEAYRVLLKEEIDDVPSDAMTAIAERAREMALSGSEGAPVVRAGATSTADPAASAPPPGAPPGAGGDPPGGTPPSPIGVRMPVDGEPLRTRIEPPEPVPLSESLGRTLTVLMSISIVAAAIAVVMNVFDVQLPWNEEPGRVPAPKTVLLRVSEAVPGGHRYKTLEVDAEGATISTVVPDGQGEVHLLTYQSPDGRLEARRVPTPNGPDLEIVDARTGELVAAVPNRDGRTPDDHVQGWSPDSRVLLFDSGLFDENGEYDSRLFLFDVETRALRALSERRVANSRSPGWSPDGTRIAFESYRPGGSAEDPRTDILMVSIDGRTERWLTEDDAREIEINWSPDGTRLAFEKMTPDDSDIHVLDVATGSVTPVAHSGWPEKGPRWLSNDDIAFVMAEDGRKRVWAVAADGSSPPRQLTDGWDAGDVWQRLGPIGSAPWIESVTAAAPDPMLSPGEHAVLDVDIRDAAGDPVHPADCGFEWIVLDPRRATMLDDRMLLATDTGTVRVVANVGGWRADTLVFASRPLAVTDTELLFEELWQEGIRDSIWTIFGDPEPLAAAGEGPAGDGAFLNNGDENHGSGAYTTSYFPATEGISIEAWGRVRLTGGHFQTWELQLGSDVGRHSASGELMLGDVVATVQLISEGAGQGGSAFLFAPPLAQPLPRPTGIDAWRRHVVQLHPDGSIEWIIDGRRYASLARRDPPPDSVRVVIAGRMVDTTVEHGPVRVWRGLRYVPE